MGAGNEIIYKCEHQPIDGTGSRGTTWRAPWWAKRTGSHGRSAFCEPPPGRGDGAAWRACRGRWIGSKARAVPLGRTEGTPACNHADCAACQPARRGDDPDGRRARPA